MICANKKALLTIEAEWQIGHQKSHPSLSAFLSVVSCVPILLLNHSIVHDMM